MKTIVSERTKPRLKARFPRLALLKLRRRQSRDWIASADADGNVFIHPTYGVAK